MAGIGNPTIWPQAHNGSLPTDVSSSETGQYSPQTNPEINEQADAIVFIASDEASLFTGYILNVDGGGAAN
jgi:NAD(P)-dependent dehydrogenase (short-subunit alcohol dehydrogenase family)